jgi:hypothetical protein
VSSHIGEQCWLTSEEAGFGQLLMLGMSAWVQQGSSVEDGLSPQGGLMGVGPAASLSGM